jgi:hypothetical protein
LKKNQNLKIALKFQIIDEKRTVIKKEKHSNEIQLNENFVFFNNQKITL